MAIIIAALIVMAVLAVLFAVGLALASKAFAIDMDERVEKILEILPSANCGACGYGGCRAYAEAVVGGEKLGLCKAVGDDGTQKLASIMGVEAVMGPRLRAVVHCQGGTNNCSSRADYAGPQDCRAAHITSGGPKACLYGCLGMGTCASSCPFEAMTMSEQGLPVIDPEKCVACGICTKVCPRNLISLLDVRYKIYLGCSSRDSGKRVKDICSVGCIACGRCEKKDPKAAVVLKDNLPVLDFEKAAGDFTVAAESCPMGCFVVEGKSELAAAAPKQAEQVG